MAWHRNIVATRTVMIGGVMLLAGLLVATGHLGSAAIAEEKGKAENQSTIKQCDDAKQRSHRGEWENAKSKYEEILKAFPTSDCASAGLKALLETKNRCDIGAALKKAKLWDEAKKQYDAAFVNSPTSECAVNGLKEILEEAAKAQDHLSNANAKAEANNAEDAFKALEEARKINPSLKGSDQLQKLHDAKMLGKKAASLATLGLPDDALKGMKDALEKNYAAITPPELDYLLPQEPAKSWGKFRQALLPALSAIGEIFLLAITCVLIIAVVWNKGPEFLRYLFRGASVDVGTFVRDGLDEERLGETFSTLLESKICRLQVDPVEFDLHVVTSPASAGAKFDLTLLAPPNLQWLGKALAPILDLVATPHLVVAGRLHAPAILWPHATLTLQLTRGNAILASEVLRLRDFQSPELGAKPKTGKDEKDKPNEEANDDSKKNPAADAAETAARQQETRRALDRLASVAAVWAHFEAQRVPGKDIAHFGTTNWRSCAYFQVALQERTESDMAAAQFYLKSLRADPDNRASRVNFARVLVNLHKDRTGEAIAHLNKALRLGPRQFNPGTVWRRILLRLRGPIDTDSTPYVAMFLKSTLYYDLSVMAEKRNDVHEFARLRKAAERHARRLIEKIKAALKTVEGRPAYGIFSKYLCDVLVQAQLIHAGFMVASTTNPAKGEKLMSEIAASHALSADPAVHYNLACSYALLTEHKYVTDSQQATKCLATAKKHLERHFWLLKAMGTSEDDLKKREDRAKEDWTLKAVWGSSKQGNSVMKLLACVALILSTLAACANPYALKINSINMEAAQQTGVIQFSDPKLYKREALINERRGELTYLNKLLGKTENDDFKIEPEIVRELEMIRAFSASLGLKVDPAAGVNFQRDTEIAELKHQYELTRLDMQLSQLKRDAELFKDQLAKQQTPSQQVGTPSNNTPVTSTVTAQDPATLISKIDELRGKLEDRLKASVPSPQKSTGVAGPIDTFNDVSAYRDVLKSAINAASLDELHDKDGNSLFRVQLRATVLPATKDYLDTLGVLRMEVGRPTLNEEHKRQLYAKWLLHVNRNLNLVPGPERTVKEQRIRTSPGLVTLGQIGDLYEITLLELPKQGLKEADKVKKSSECKGVRETERMPDVCWYVRIATPPLSPNGVRFSDVLDRSDQFVNGLAGTLDGARKSLNTMKGFDNADMPTDLFTLDSNCRAFRFPASSTTFLLRADDPKKMGTTPADALAQAQSVRTWWPHASAVIGFLTEIDFGNDAVAESIPNQLSQTLDKFRSVHEAAGAFLTEVAAKNPTCRARILTPASTVAPPVFGAMIESIDTRIAVYDVAPTERVQRISTAARAADAISLAAAVAGQLPSYGMGASGNFAYSRTATGKADALERAPLVVGFTEPGADTNGNRPSFGWLLGPEVSLDPKHQSLVLSQRVKPYDLYVDLSLPGWWPYFELTTYTAWAPEWRSAKKGATITDAALKRIVRITMEHNGADIDGLTTLLLEKSTGGRVAHPTILSIEPRVISACADVIKFQVRGENIWRASLVHVGGLAIKDASVEVLPDMRGVLVSIPTKDIPKIIDGPNIVTVWTKDGPASFPITFEDKRKPDGKCETRSTPTPEPKGPKITAVAPDAISVCDTDAVFTVVGKNLGGANSAVFGTMASHSVAEVGPLDGTVVQINVSGIDGKKKMVGLDIMTLAVRTPKGAATTDVKVIQSPTQCK